MGEPLMNVIMPPFYADPREKMKTLFKPKLEKFIDISIIDAEKILGIGNASPSDRALFSRIPKIKFGFTKNVILLTNNGSSREEIDEKRVAVGIGGIILGALGILTMGKSINQIRQANQELKKIHRFKIEHLDLWEKIIRMDCGGMIPAHSHFQTILELEKARSHLYKGYRNRALISLILSVSLVGSAAVALAGAIFASGPLMLVGTVSALVIGAGMLLNWSIQSYSNQEENDAKRMKKIAEKLWFQEKIEMYRS